MILGDVERWLRIVHTDVILMHEIAYTPMDYNE